MTQTTEPPKVPSAPVPGQIDNVNPIELFWEKHRKPIVTGLVLFAVAVGLYYGVEYVQRQAVNARWSEFASVTKLDQAYAVDGSGIDELKNAKPDAEIDQTNWSDRLNGFSFRRMMYIDGMVRALVEELPEHVKSADRAALDKTIEAHAGQKTEPWLLWTAAGQAFLNRSWDASLGYLDRLQTGFPNHALCMTSEFPPQFRAEIKEDDEDEDEPTAAPAQPAEKKYREPVEGSPVSILRAAIEKQRKFRADNPGLYDPPATDASPVAVVTFDIDGDEHTAKIGFYGEHAKAHVDNFVAKAKAGFYDGQKVHEIVRQAQGPVYGLPTPASFAFGLEVTKTEDAKDKWTEPPIDEAEKTAIDFEFSDELSHFPGALAAAVVNGAESKSSDSQVWINFDDAAHAQDGERVVFGRVIEGMDVIEQIAKADLFTTEEERAGRGKPNSTITIKSIAIEE